MQPQITFIVSWLCLFLTAFALPTREVSACISEISLPTITLRPSQGVYENVYTRTYQDFAPQGLTTVVYTLTQTCSTIDCPVPLETAPPAGFTQAVVADGTVTATLTFPTQSLAAYSSVGYVVMPIHTAAPAQGDSSFDRKPDSGTLDTFDTSSPNNGSSADNSSDSSHSNAPSSASSAVTPSYSSSSDAKNTPNTSTKASSTSANPHSNDNSGSNSEATWTISVAGATKLDLRTFTTVLIASILISASF
ncbi:hypothetical protein FBEOM_4482 [Fusarium beomiforme]|uniref:Uncharacterized protein n=1 Tax=Fusarium beomiforme TaxID=44412 RepID=A0A9P5AMP2_9HYPO|nr:hypothetical protein FBEOM_4482 [Fusarium beomiforme]